MLSASGGKSAAAAERYYYDKDPVMEAVTEGHASQWLGGGAEALGLSGDVERKDFRAVCDGLCPATGKALSEEMVRGSGKEGEERRGGNDLTFSAPKSVSVAFAVGGPAAQDLKAAHDAAISAAMKHIEQHNSHYVKTEDGVKIFENGKLLAAQYDHATSRNLDPQLHSHVFVVNSVQAPDGSWKANDPLQIYRDQRVLGLMYRQELAHQLEMRGFEYQFDQTKENARQNMYIELKSVDKTLCNDFSSRSKEVDAKVEGWKKDGVHKGLSEAELHAKAAIDTRNSKNTGITKEEIDKLHDQTFEKNNTTREALAEKVEVDRQAVLATRELQTEKATELAINQVGPVELENQRAKFAQEGEPAVLVVGGEGEAHKSTVAPQEGEKQYTALDVLALAAASMTDKEAIMDRAKLMETAIHISGGKHGIEELNQAIDGGGNGVEERGRSRNGREYYTTTQIRELEARNLQNVKDLANTFQSCTTKEEVGAYLAGRAREEYAGSGEYCAAYEAGIGAADRAAAAGADNNGSVKLSDGQRGHVLNELAGTHGVAVTGGDPGTGKSYASGIIEGFNQDVLQASGRHHFSINVAYTAQAAKVLGEESGRPSYTIDSALNAYSKDRIKVLGEGQSLTAAEGKKGVIGIPAHAQVVLRTDESSFLGAKQGEHLLRVVQDFQNQGIHCKIQLVGDSKQLQSIQAGDLHRQILALGAEFVDLAQMKDINRQKYNPELLAVAMKLNEDGDRKTLGENAKSAIEALDKMGAVHQEADRAKLIERTTEKYMEASNREAHDPKKAAQGQKQSVLLVTATNADRIELNRNIREARINAGEMERGRSIEIEMPKSAGVTADPYKDGDTVVFSGYRDKNGHTQAWGSKKLHQEGTVVGRDLEKNTVTVQWSFQDKDKKAGTELTKIVTRTFSAAEMATKTTLFQKDNRDIAAGDRIVCLKNDKGLGVENGTRGLVRSIEGNILTMTVERSKGPKDITIDLSTYNKIDHAYCVTTHKSQGATVDHSLMFAFVKPEKGQNKAAAKEPTSRPWDEIKKEVFGRSSYNQLNVGVTRARYEAELITNDKAGLVKACQQVTEKTTTIPKEKTKGKEKGERVEQNQAGQAEKSSFSDQKNLSQEAAGGRGGEPTGRQREGAPRQDLPQQGEPAEAKKEQSQVETSTGGQGKGTTDQAADDLNKTVITVVQDMKAIEDQGKSTTEKMVEGVKSVSEKTAELTGMGRSQENPHSPAQTAGQSVGEKLQNLQEGAKSTQAQKGNEFASPEAGQGSKDSPSKDDSKDPKGPKGPDLEM